MVHVKWSHVSPFRLNYKEKQKQKKNLFNSEIFVKTVEILVQNWTFCIANRIIEIIKKILITASILNEFGFSLSFHIEAYTWTTSMCFKLVP